MGTSKVKGDRGTRGPVELFGAIDEAREMCLGEHGGTGVAAYVIPATLRASAGSAITCPQTGEVLDYRTVVVVSVYGADDGDGRTPGPEDLLLCRALSPRGWSSYGPRLIEVCGDEGYSVKVLTLRHLEAVKREREAVRS